MLLPKKETSARPWQLLIDTTPLAGIPERGVRRLLLPNLLRREGRLLAHHVDPATDRAGRYRRVTAPP
jgi:hypothetical protein